MKYIAILLTLLLGLNATAALPLKGKGQSEASMTEIHKLTVPSNQITRSSPTTAHLETGNKNLFTNPGFEHATPDTGWTIAATGTATCTTVVSTVSGISGENQYLLLTATGGVSGGTCSIKQEVSATTGMQALVGAWFNPEAMGGTGGPTTVLYTLVNGSRITERDISNTGTSASWQSFFVPEVANTTIGVEALITVAASTEVNLGIDAAVAKVGDVTQTASIITPWQSYTPTFTGFGTVSTQNFRWRQVGSSIQIEGRFQAGTTSATEARISLPNSYTSWSGYVSPEQAGTAIYSASGTHSIYSLIEPSVSYLTLGVQNGSLNGFTKQNGSSFSSSSYLSIHATVRITNLSVSTQVFASNCGAACENELTAKLTSAPTVTSENVDFINNGSVAFVSSVYTVPFNSGIFTVAPKCECSPLTGVTTAADRTCQVVDVSTSQVRFITSGNGSLNSYSIEMSCSKQGADHQSSRTIVGSFRQMADVAILRDEKASGTAGGSSVVGWQTRALTTEYDDNGIVSLSANQFTLGAGKYEIYAIAPLYIGYTQARIYNVTDASVAITGEVGYSSGSGHGYGYGKLNGFLTITSSKTFRLEQYSSTATATNGLGLPVSATTEIYSVVKIRRISP